MRTNVHEGQHEHRGHHFQSHSPAARVRVQELPERQALVLILRILKRKLRVSHCHSYTLFNSHCACYRSALVISKSRAHYNGPYAQVLIM